MRRQKLHAAVVKSDLSVVLMRTTSPGGMMRVCGSNDWFLEQCMIGLALKHKFPASGTVQVLHRVCTNWLSRRLHRHVSQSSRCRHMILYECWQWPVQNLATMTSTTCFFPKDDEGQLTYFLNMSLHYHHKCNPFATAVATGKCCN